VEHCELERNVKDTSNGLGTKKKIQRFVLTTSKLASRRPDVERCPEYMIGCDSGCNLYGGVDLLILPVGRPWGMSWAEQDVPSRA
jgi:hypothetical protein